MEAHDQGTWAARHISIWAGHVRGQGICPVHVRAWMCPYMPWAEDMGMADTLDRIYMGWHQQGVRADLE
jgi:hypothetical protein